GLGVDAGQRARTHITAIGARVAQPVAAEAPPALAVLTIGAGVVAGAAVEPIVDDVGAHARVALVGARRAHTGAGDALEIAIAHGAAFAAVEVVEHRGGAGAVVAAVCASHADGRAGAAELPISARQQDLAAPRRAHHVGLIHIDVDDDVDRLTHA